MPDTNVLIGDRDSVEKLINGENLVVIPLTVLCELDKLKNDSRIGSEVRMTIKEIEGLVFSNNPQLIVEKNTLFDGLNLQKDLPDNKIMATFNYVIKNSEVYGGYQKYKLVTEHINMRVIAHSLFNAISSQIMVEAYHANTINLRRLKEEFLIISAVNNEISLDYTPEVYGEVPENGGVIIEVSKKETEERLAGTIFTIRKGNKLEIIPPDIEIFGLTPRHNGSPNWGQILAFRQLTDRGIHCVFIQGPAGTGKTLMAIAAALEQNQNFEQRILVSPMVPLSNQQKLGFLPGDIKEKSSPWLAPFSQNIHFLETKQKSKMSKLLIGKGKNKPLKVKNGSKEFDDGDSFVNLWEKYGFICQPLEYIRGQTIINAFIIIEEAQNLSQHEVKTIITRAGEGTKLVFCGDLSQIDLPYISLKNSGLTYAIEKISGTGYKNKMVGVSVLSQTVRSKLSAFASEVM